MILGCPEERKGDPAARGKSAQTQTVTAAYVPAGYYLPFLVMEELGLLEKRGYSLELRKFHDNSEMISAFLNGHLDVTAQSAFTMFPVEAEHPGMFKFIYGQYCRSYTFVVPSGSKYHSLADLREATIGTWKSPTAEAYIKLLLGRAGLGDGDYHIRKYGAVEWPAVLQNKGVDVAFGFDVPAAQLVQSGAFRYLDENATNQLGPNGRVFNGGAFVSTRLITEQSRKAEAIRDAMFEALDTIRREPDRVRQILAVRLNMPATVAAVAKLDEFTWPNPTLESEAAATLGMLQEEGYVPTSVRATQLFWMDSK